MAKSICYVLACCMICTAMLFSGCDKKESGAEPTPPPGPTPPDPPTPTEDTTLYVCDELCTPNPSPEALKLYTYLRKTYGRKVLSGAMANVNWNINEAEWVKYHTGKYPAMTCFDMIQSTMTDDWAKKQYASFAIYEDWWANNGIIMGMWHHMVPKTQATTTTTSNSTYKPNETSFKASNALISGTWENKIFMQDLDRVAEFLQGFRDRHIPILWRPYHEAAGQWFWWGKGGDAATEVQLWQFMWDYFVNTKGLNNLIWVWTTQGSDYAWYPGDKYVDIIGRDIYNKTAPSFYNYFGYDQMIYPNKMLTLSEFGNGGTIQDQWNAGAKWAYFMPWYDSKRTKSASPNSYWFTDTTTPHEHAPIEWWNNAWEQPYVISRDQMPSLK